MSFFHLLNLKEEVTVIFFKVSSFVFNKIDIFISGSIISLSAYLHVLL